MTSATSLSTPTHSLDTPLSAPLTRSTTRVNAVIFDCDGTLVDSETSGMTALYEEACKLGYSLSLSQALHDFRGRRLSLCVEMIEANIGGLAPADFMPGVRLAMAKKFNTGVTAMPGAPALLDALRGADVPYCIASNGPLDKMELTLGLSGLQGYFEKHVFSAYEVGHWKPDPELFLHAAREMGLAASDCVVVEDSLPGVEAALAAGMKVYFMGDADVVPASLVDHIIQIEGLGDLHQAFELNCVV